MTTGDESLRGLIGEVFAALVERGEIDIVPGEEGTGIEIQADRWTLAIEGAPPVVAFLAIDEEPASVEEMAEALEGIVEADELEALRELNRRLAGTLRIALQQSADMLSMELASLLDEEPRGRE